MREPVDPSRIALLADGMPGGVQGLVNLFVSHVGATLTELREASDAARAEDVRQLAHRACGAAGAIGAPVLLERLRHVESLGRQRAMRGIDSHVRAVEEEFVRVSEYLAALVARYRGGGSP
jgi:HPt (histidine-containing phosphotransfer) domain-containing protein